METVLLAARILAPHPVAGEDGCGSGALEPGMVAPQKVLSAFRAEDKQAVVAAPAQEQLDHPGGPPRHGLRLRTV